MKNKTYHIFFKNLASPARVQIISKLSENPSSVNELSQKLKIEQSKLSHALTSLKKCKIVDVKQKGNATRLTPIQLKELDTILSEKPTKYGIPFTLWTTTLVQYIIFKQFDVSYNQSAIWKITKKLDYNLKVPRQQNKKSSLKAKKLFKKELKKKFNITLNLDSRSSVLMKHTSQYNPT